jgi:hypothetical protein
MCGKGDAWSSVEGADAMIQVVTQDTLLKPAMDPAVAAAYRLLGLLPTAHPLVVAKARTALLAVSTSPKRWEEIEEAYRLVCDAQRESKTKRS